MNKLIAVEACRCLSVVQDMIDTLEQLQYVTPVLQSRVDMDALFGKTLADRLREYIRTRQQLESAIQDQNAMKAGGFRSRQSRLEKRIQEATQKFTKETHELAMIFAQSTEFLQKVKQNVNNLSELLPQQYVQTGGGQGKSVASASVAQDQTTVGPQATGQPSQHFSSIKDLIDTLQHMRTVVQTNMNTSVQMEQNKKQHISQLSNSEQSMRNLVNTYQKDEKLMIAKIEAEEGGLTDQIKTVQEKLEFNAQTAEQTVNELFTTCSQTEVQKNEEFTKLHTDFANQAGEMSRKLNEIVKKSLETIRELQKQKRRFYLSIKEDARKLDEACFKLDEDIYRARYEINLSDARIKVLKQEIEEYNKDKLIRDQQDKGDADVIKRHWEQWDLKELLESLEGKEIR